MNQLLQPQSPKRNYGMISVLMNDYRVGTQVLTKSDSTKGAGCVPGTLASLEDCSCHKIQLQVCKLSSASSTSHLLRVAKEVFA